jgi:branched-chain amino acid transport system substrate-binding protein
VFKRYFGNNKTFLPIATSFIMIRAGLSACASQNSAPTFSNPNPIVIGISLPLTANKDNDFSSDGQAMKQGYELWASMVNNSGGLLGRPVKLLILDDNSDPNKVVQTYDTLINKDHVDLLLGPFSTLLTKAAIGAPGLTNGTPGISKYAFIEGAGGAQSVFDAAKADKLHNLFDVSLPINNNLVTFVDYILSLPAALRPTTAGYLTSDDPFTFPQVQIAEALLEKAGVKTVYTNAAIQYPEGNTAQATADVKQLIQAKPEVVVLGTLLPDIQLEIAQFKKAHYNPEAMIATAGPDGGQDFIKAIDGIKYADGVFVPNGWYPQANNYQNADMVNAYLSQYGGTADQINADIAEAFSCGQVLQQAADKIGSIDNTKLIAELRSGDVFNTVQGTASFDSTGYGENTQAIAYLFQWQGSQFIPVYPYSVAAQNPEYPKSAVY